MITQNEVKSGQLNCGVPIAFMFFAMVEMLLSQLFCWWERLSSRD
jgi:hypothetical protein